jgi:hypothetical protein
VTPPPGDAKPERGAGRRNGGRAGRAARPPQSVADLLAGEGRRLVPQGIQHYARRRAVAGSKRARNRREQKPVS